MLFLRLRVLVVSMVLKRNQNIVLIGFMGSGKSKVGKVLARKLKMNYMDMDMEIEKKEGRSIPQIFRDSGEFYFRRRESDIIMEISKQENTVISAGGGAVLLKKNVSRLKKSGVIVWLKAKPETIAKRVGAAKNRPLLSCQGNKDKEDAVRLLLKERTPYYRSAHDAAVQTDGITAEETAERIIKIIRGQGAGDSKC